MGSNQHGTRWLMVGCVLALVVIGGAFSSVLAQSRDAKNGSNSEVKGEPVGQETPYVPHQLVVRLSTSTTASDPLKIEMVESIQAALSQAPVYLVAIDPSLNEETAAAQMRLSSSVAYVHPNYRLNSAFPIQGSYPFSDEKFVGSIGGQTAAQLLGVNSAHQLASGAGVTVAVIDGGVDAANPELGGTVVSGYDYVDMDGDASDDPRGSTSGHGTFVAGLVHLMAPQATIKSYRVMTPAGNGDGFTLARAIEQAVLDGCDVINLSVALTERHWAVREAIDYAAANGVIVVAGAGNGGTNTPVYPAAEANVIAVAAIDSMLHPADFTSFGNYVDVCAPGTNVYSAYQAPLNAWWSGTSFSAPFVSGLAALLMQAQPTSHWLHIRNAIVEGARSLDTLNPTMTGELGSGVIDPVASLTLATSNETAAVIPDTMHFVHYEGAMYAVIPSQTAVLVSSNGPAAYTTEVHRGGPTPFARPKEVSGMTNDSVVIYCEPWLLTPGDYADTILFNVDGVLDPARLVVSVTVFPFGDTVEGAYVTPGSLWFTAQVHREILLSQKATIVSQNSPAAYTGTLIGGDHMVTQFTASGETNDTITVVVDPSLKTVPGLYVDSIRYDVAGIANPALLLVYTTITDSTAQGDSAWLDYDSSLIDPIVIEEGSIGMYGGCIGVNSTNAPATFTVSMVGTPKFASVQTPSGQTNSSFCYGINVGTLTPGGYTDTFLVAVAGVVNSPLLCPVTIIVVPSGGGGGGPDSVIVTPQTNSFVAKLGEASVQYGMFSVMNGGGPTSFTVTHLDTPDFTQLLDTGGVTDDSVRFRVTSPASMPAGVYCDTLLVHVSGIGSPFVVVNTLRVTDSLPGGGGNGAAYAMPSSISLGLSTAPTDTVYRGLVLISNNAPAAYTAGIVDAPAEFVYLPKTSGWTNDSVLIAIRPNTLPNGVYEDSVVFTISGVADPVLVVIRLAIGDSTASSRILVTAHQNYPNPFNPSTTILFSLERPARVTLDVFNMLGQQVTTLVTDEMSAGSHSVIWDGTDAAGAPVGSGIYFYRLTADQLTVSRKMLLVK